MNPFMALAWFFSITFVSFIVICGLMNVSSLVGIFITTGVMGAIDQEPLESAPGLFRLNTDNLSSIPRTSGIRQDFYGP